MKQLNKANLKHFKYFKVVILNANLFKTQNCLFCITVFSPTAKP